MRYFEQISDADRAPILLYLEYGGKRRKHLRGKYRSAVHAPIIGSAAKV